MTNGKICRIQELKHLISSKPSACVHWEKHHGLVGDAGFENIQGKVG